MSEQWIIIAGDNVHMPVGPFASEKEAHAYYQRNQPRDDGPYRTPPTIIRMLRPASLLREDEDA